LVVERPYREALKRPAASTQQDGTCAVTAGDAPPDDLAREVYCVLGVPIEAVDMAEVLRRIKVAAACGVPYTVSTPNINFVTSCRSDAEFRESLLQSDLCPVDGMPIVWIARALGLPIRQRIAGSDIFAMLKAQRNSWPPLRVFLFGGGEGVAAAAARSLNAAPAGLTCVGDLYPGYGTVDDMSTTEIINSINASGADFVAVALSAAKGQAWVHRNRDRLFVPVRAQLGAALNFQAGTLKRAPATIRKLGLEWLWRIKEEPYLWRRYFRDGASLLKLLLTRVLPLLVLARWPRWVAGGHGHDLKIRRSNEGEAVVLALSGAAEGDNLDKATAWFRDALATRRPIVIDLSGVDAVDARFLGLLFMLRKQVGQHGARLSLTGASPHLARMFRLNCAEFLLPADGVS
jgi:N-acetylglucosaminyldiphosphoundecaprenol N-acetyl-beta-D-mannosaminyltransferase